MTNLRLVLQEWADDAQWDLLVDRSPQGTIFSKSDFLRCLGSPFKRFLVGSLERPIALCAVVEDTVGHSILAFEFTPYQGILFYTTENHYHASGSSTNSG